jgi:hypothetical protein
MQYETRTAEISGDFEVEIEIPDGTAGELRLFAGADIATAPAQVGLKVDDAGVVTPRVCYSGTWTEFNS